MKSKQIVVVFICVVLLLGEYLLFYRMPIEQIQNNNEIYTTSDICKENIENISSITNIIESDFLELNCDSEIKCVLGAEDLLPDEFALYQTKELSNLELDSFFQSDDNTILLESYPEEGIYIYGFKPSKEFETAWFRGIGVVKNQTLWVFDVLWGVYTEVPEFSLYDFDQDDLDEIGMITRSSQGTEINMQNLYMFDWDINDEQGECIAYGDREWQSDLKHSMSFQRNGDIIVVSIKGEKDRIVDIKPFEEKWSESLTDLRFSEICSFTFSNHKIYLHTAPFGQVSNYVTVQQIFESDYTFEVKYMEAFSICYGEEVTKTNVFPNKLYFEGYNNTRTDRYQNLDDFRIMGHSLFENIVFWTYQISENEAFDKLPLTVLNTNLHGSFVIGWDDGIAYVFEENSMIENTDSGEIKEYKIQRAPWSLLLTSDKYSLYCGLTVGMKEKEVQENSLRFKQYNMQEDSYRYYSSEYIDLLVEEYNPDSIYISDDHEQITMTEMEEAGIIGTTCRSIVLFIKDGEIILITMDLPTAG